MTKDDLIEVNGLLQKCIEKIQKRFQIYGAAAVRSGLTAPVPFTTDSHKENH